MKKLFIMAFFSVCAVACGLGGGDFYSSPEEYFRVAVSQESQISVTPPNVFWSEVDYPGIRAVRINKEVEIRCEWMEEYPNRIRLKIKNNSTENWNWVWLVVVKENNLEVLNPDARDPKNQALLRIGPLASGMAVDKEIDTSALPPGFILADVWEVEEISLDNYFKLGINSLYQISLEPPSAFSQLLDYPGITGTRSTDRIELNSEWASAEHNQLVIEIKNTGSQTLKRVWVIIREEQNLSVKNPRIRNAQNQAILVFGPLEPGMSVIKNLQIEITDFPARLVIDVIEVKHRIAYVSDWGFSMAKSIWSMSFNKDDILRITPQSQRITQGNPVWTPGMELIAFDYNDLDQWELNRRIFAAHPDGSNFQQVTESGKRSENPNFSPTGKEIIYSCYDRLSSQDICLKDISGGAEQVLARGDGYYWNGAEYQEYYPGGWYEKRVYRPTWSTDGDEIVFFTRHPVRYGRWNLLSMEFDPNTLTPQSDPQVLGWLFDGDTLTNYCVDPEGGNTLINYCVDRQCYVRDSGGNLITNSCEFAYLYECVPKFTPDGNDLLCFLQVLRKPNKTDCRCNFWASSFSVISFQGIARIRLQELKTNPNAYIANYINKIYDTRALPGTYKNFLTYSPELGGIIFTNKFTDSLSSFYLLPVDSNFVPSPPAYLFYSNSSDNGSPAIPPPIYPGFYQ